MRGGPRLRVARPGRGAAWRRPVLVTVVVLVLLIALTAVADVVIARRAESRITTALRCATGDDSIAPELSLGRTPVLLQLVSGSFGTVTIDGLPVSSISTAGRAADLLGAGEVDLTLHDVGPGRPVTVGSATASATIGWDALTERLGSAGDAEDDAAQALSGATFGWQDGLLAVTLQQRMLGAPLTVLMRLEVDGTSLTLTPETVAVGDRLVQASLLAGLAGRLGTGAGNPLDPRTVDLDLPEGVTLQAVSGGDAGLGVDLAVAPDALGKRGNGGGCLG
ncbi:DUF2993 domain-containing protein [Kineosporia sp. J2-2]|uniref:DUF2993 domain-containing protein n=1 Tax=Kineosporia corallincola TaxID=2835133 RepID=A0ABS5TT51_9ACTN|nr:DUF2993 domain-containing protein [Kineosporia corallincola]MBT0773997.1 DUF2993 domain-containing protein [Kineosporia corallincola]